MLEFLAHQVVKRRIEVLLIAIFLAGLGIFGILNTRVNYDLLSYLPEKLDSVKGLKIIREKFGLGTTTQLVVENLSDVKVEKLKKEIESIPGVEKVSWVTDLADITIPREFWQEELVKNYYGKNATLMQISFKNSPSDPSTKEAFKKIKELLKEKKAYLAGTVASSLDLEELMKTDRVKYTLASLALVSLVLFLTIPSIIVPVLFILTIGFGVIYNLGLSFYLNQELSYLTSAIVFSLQFAVTMDYALFLYHRFEEEREKLSDEEAMAKAIVSSFKAVSSASLTTVAGFLALSAMQLGFGTDMGLTLARGVFITLLCNLTILPSLLLVFDPMIKKIAHRSYLPNFEKVSQAITKYPTAFLLIFLLLFLPAFYGYSKVEKSFNLQEGMPENLPSNKAQDILEEKFGKKETIFLVMKEPPTMNQLQETVTKAEKTKGVSAVFGYPKLIDPLLPQEFIPEEAKKAFFSDGYTYCSVDLKYGGTDKRTDQTIKSLKEIAKGNSSKTYITGSAVLLKDLEKIFEGDVNRVNLLSIIAIFLIVAIAFRSFGVPIVMVSIIELAILLNQGVSAFTGSKVSFVAALAIGAIQLGSTVDYAILMTSRFEEEVRKTRSRFLAIKKAIEESSQSILVSAGTMFAATIGMALLSSIGILKGLATLISRGALISLGVVIFLLPALLYLGQPLFERTSINWPIEEVKGGDGNEKI